MTQVNTLHDRFPDGMIPLIENVHFDAYNPYPHCACVRHAQLRAYE